MEEIRIQGIRITGPIEDGSGYGEGLRKWVKCLFNKGIPMQLQPVSFEQDRPQLDKEMELINNIKANPRPADIHFIRLGPENAVRFKDPAMINICSCAWETSKLAQEQVDACNQFDAVFVESNWLVDVFIDSGVNVPVFCIPNVADTSRYVPKEQPNLDSTYKFYSIQQWTERKNGIGLLKSYFNAFTEEDDVVLFLKTYVTRVQNVPDQGEKIKQDIDHLKRLLNLPKKYPKVFLITEKLSNEEMIKMHEDCDCYVMLDRAEGFGLPYMDAACAGNPIIATDFGGSRQFLNDQNSYAIPYQLTYVWNMGHMSPLYQGDQLWADPDLTAATQAMQHVFNNRKEAWESGRRLREEMENNFNSDVIANSLLKSIAEVVRMKKQND